MDENEEDIEEFDSDSDGEVMNVASDLMCSTPPGASPTTLSSSSLLSTLLRVSVFLIGGHPTKNIIEDLTRSVQISQEMVRSSYQIYLIRTQVKNLTCSYQISLV